MCLFGHTARDRRSFFCVERTRRVRVLLFFYGNDRDYPSKIYAGNRYADALSEIVRSSRGVTMEVGTVVANAAGHAAVADETENSDLGFLPKRLTEQCQGLIESYHELHGYTCLPDILWKARLGPFIENHREFRQLLKKASTTRSAKKSNQGFVRIATTILSLEILASSFAGWSAIYPEAGLTAHALLKRYAQSPHMPLMEFYLYPPKYVSAAAIAALALPLNRPTSEAELYRASTPELSGEKLALNYVTAIRQSRDGSLPQTASIA
jgi:hypothetical protein